MTNNTCLQSRGDHSLPQPYSIRGHAPQSTLPEPRTWATVQPQRRFNTDRCLSHAAVNAASSSRGVWNQELIGNGQRNVRPAMNGEASKLDRVPGSITLSLIVISPKASTPLTDRTGKRASNNLPLLEIPWRSHQVSPAVSSWGLSEHDTPSNSLVKRNPTHEICSAVDPYHHASADSLSVVKTPHSKYWGNFQAAGGPTEHGADTSIVLHTKGLPHQYINRALDQRHEAQVGMASSRWCEQPSKTPTHGSEDTSSSSSSTTVGPRRTPRPYIPSIQDFPVQHLHIGAQSDERAWNTLAGYQHLNSALGEGHQRSQIRQWSNNAWNNIGNVPESIPYSAASSADFKPWNLRSGYGSKATSSSEEPSYMIHGFQNATISPNEHAATRTTWFNEQNAQTTARGQERDQTPSLQSLRTNDLSPTSEIGIVTPNEPFFGPRWLTNARPYSSNLLYRPNSTGVQLGYSRNHQQRFQDIVSRSRGYGYDNGEHSPHPFSGTSGCNRTLPDNLYPAKAFLPYNDNSLTISDSDSGILPLRYSSAEEISNAVEGIRSAVLSNFKAKDRGQKRIELQDIFGHVVEFSGDQDGSRFIQKKLEDCNSEEKQRLFDEIYLEASALIKDVFGNYVIQKFFEHGDQKQKMMLADVMRGQVEQLSIQTYACRVVQKALEHILVDQQVLLIRELEHSVLDVVRDQNGNHVVQKIIEIVPARYLQRMICSFYGQILHELHDASRELVTNSFGNYVIQHIIQQGSTSDRERIMLIVMSDLVAFSKHKFASNVVENCVKHGSEQQRQHMVSMLCQKNNITGESTLANLTKDNYGNYVIQKLLDCLNEQGARRFAAELYPQVDSVLRVSGHNKSVENVMRKLQQRLHLGLAQQPQHQMFLPLQNRNE